MDDTLFFLHASFPQLSLSLVEEILRLKGADAFRTLQLLTEDLSRGSEQSESSSGRNHSTCLHSTFQQAQNQKDFYEESLTETFAFDPASITRIQKAASTQSGVPERIIGDEQFEVMSCPGRMEDAEDFDLNSIHLGSCMLADLFSDNNPEVALAPTFQTPLMFPLQTIGSDCWTQSNSDRSKTARSESDRLALGAGGNSVSSPKEAELDRADLVESSNVYYEEALRDLGPVCSPTGGRKPETEIRPADRLERGEVDRLDDLELHLEIKSEKCCQSDISSASSAAEGGALKAKSEVPKFAANEAECMSFLRNSVKALKKSKSRTRPIPLPSVAPPLPPGLFSSPEVSPKAAEALHTPEARMICSVSAAKSKAGLETYMDCCSYCLKEFETGLSEKERREIDKFLRLTVTQISRSERQILNQTRQIDSFLERQDGLERKLFCQTRLAEILIKASLSKIEATVSSVAYVARNLIRKLPNLLQLLMFNLHKVSPLSVPMYWDCRDGSIESLHDYQKKMKYSQYSDGVESTDSYIDRQLGAMTFHAVLVTNTNEDIQYGLADGWSYLSRFLNNIPPNRTTISCLFQFFKIAGHALYTKYKKQFVKLLKFADDKYTSADLPGDAAGAVSRLKTYISTKEYQNYPRCLTMPKTEESLRIHA